MTSTQYANVGILDFETLGAQNRRVSRFEAASHSPSLRQHHTARTAPPVGALPGQPRESAASLRPARRGLSGPPLEGAPEAAEVGESHLLRHLRERQPAVDDQLE